MASSPQPLSKTKLPEEDQSNGIEESTGLQEEPPTSDKNVNFEESLLVQGVIYPISFQAQIGEIAIEASDIVSRLGQAVETPKTPTENVRKAATVFLGLQKKHSNEIIHAIHELISTDEDGDPTTALSLKTVAKLVMVSHSLSAYCGSLEQSLLQRLSLRFTTDTTRWISHIFG